MCHAWPHTARSAPGPCLAFVPRVAALRPLHPAWPLCHVWLHASLEPLLLPTRGFNTQGSTPLNQSGSGRTSPRAASAASASRGSPASRSSKRPREQAAGEEGAEEEGAEEEEEEGGGEEEEEEQEEVEPLAKGKGKGKGKATAKGKGKRPT